MNRTLLALALSLGMAGAASAATIIPVNTNAAGVGLNDPAAAVPVGGNPGTTVGEQRRIAYQFAADLWGAVLQSNVDIRVNAQFTALSCTATSGTLGSAGTATVHANFDNSLPGTWYGAALANSLAGEDLATGTNDINSNFNANLGTPGCLETSGWYYGLDGNTPAGRINFLDVVMHEIGHGLNFQGFYNTTTGAPFGTAPNQFPDIYSRNVFDNASGKTWVEMTDAERLTARTQDRLVWTGANVTAQAPAALGPLVRLNATGTLTASYDFGTASFGAAPTVANFSGPVAVVNDGGANAGGAEGCLPLTNAAAVSGRVAYAIRGTCGFAVKAKVAQDAGATAIIIGNNQAGGAIGLGGADPLVTIPAISLSQADGAAVVAASPGVNAALGVVPGAFAGSDAGGRARLYAPATFAAGSTFSHFDISHSPNALMEPSINADLDGNFRIDLTPALYRDMGWVLNTGNGKTRGGACDTQVPVLRTPGLLPGANLQAADKMCRATNAGNSLGYKSCINSFVNRLATVGLIPNALDANIRVCVIR